MENLPKNDLVFKMTTFFVVMILSCVFVYIFCFLIASKKYTNIKDYQKCQNENFYKKDTSHFPQKIPANAKKIKFYCLPALYEHDSSLILLKFEVDSKYIGNELKNHEFINPNTPLGSNQNIYYMPLKFVGINSKELTYYVIKNRDNEAVESKYFPYFTGIGINKNKTQILYYFIKPD